MRTLFTFTFLLLTIGFDANAQYCMLPGRQSYSNDQPGITHFKLNTIDRTSLGVEQALTLPPVVTTGLSTELVRGMTYTVTISHSVDNVLFPGVRNNIRVWLDYNKNMSYEDAGETVISKDFEAPGTTYTTTFTVPANAPLGTTMLRATAKMSSDGGHIIPTPCDTPPDPLNYHGEMEDYEIKIVQFPTGVATSQPQIEASVYPNPTSGKVFVTLNTINDDPVSMDMYDIAGKKIAVILQNEKAQPAYAIDVNDYTSIPGVYFLKISAGSATTYQKIVKTSL